MGVNYLTLLNSFLTKTSLSQAAQLSSSRSGLCNPPPILYEKSNKVLKPAQLFGDCFRKQTSSAHVGAESGMGIFPMLSTVAAHLHGVSSEKQSRPHWCCCPCWESPTCCSSSIQGRMKSPGSSSSTSTLSWSPSRYGSQLQLPSQGPRDVEECMVWLMSHFTSPPSQKLSLGVASEMLNLGVAPL